MSERLKLRDFLSLEFIILFLCSIEFLSRFYSIILVLFIAILVRRKFKVGALKTKGFIFILLFCLFYILFAYNGTPIVVIPVWILSYIIGYCITDNSKRFVTSWFIIAIGIAIHGFLICVYNINQFGQTVMGDRIMTDIWGGGIWRGATALACSFLLGSSLIVPFFTSQQRKVGAWFFCLFIVFGAVFNSIMTASRTAIIYPAIIIFLSSLPFMGERNRVKYLFATFIVVTLLVLFYYGNVFGFRSFFESQFLFERFVDKEGGGIVENQRLELWSDFFNHFSDYFWAGGSFADNENRSYVHNILFDTIAAGGIFPGIFLVVIIVYFIKRIRQLYKSLSTNFYRSLLLGLCFGFLLIFISEPIIQAANWFFSFFLMLIGGLDRIYHLQGKHLWQ